jgi:hypothetical protein
VGTFNLLEAARQVKEKKPVLFQHVSTDEVYGSLGSEGFFVETHIADELGNPWSRTTGAPSPVSSTLSVIPSQGTRRLSGLMVPLPGSIPRRRRTAGHRECFRRCNT